MSVTADDYNLARVEYNPIRDHAGMTAAVAVKFYKELVGYLLK